MKDIAIISSYRSAIGKGVKGTLKDVRPDTIGGQVVKHVMEKSGVDPSLVEDLVMGCAMPEAEQGMNVARIIGFLGGLPKTTSAATVNRFCSSGLHAIADVAKSINSGEIDVGIGGGVESMSLVPMGGHKPSVNPELMSDYPDVYMPMGLTAEVVAEKYGVSREDQDKFSAQSHERALAAIASGKFKEEIVPLNVQVARNGELMDVHFDTDEGPRAGTSLSALSKLRPAFKQGGTVTAGNASQISDGAAAALLMDAEIAKANGCKPMAYFRSFVTAGVAPDEMGVGPVYAIRKLMDKAGLSLDDVGVFEINEAFAAQAAYSVRELGLDPLKVNPNGGAIALGHPLGCTGARQVATIIREMQREGHKYGVCSMCIGGGMGAAGLIELA